MISSEHWYVDWSDPTLPRVLPYTPGCPYEPLTRIVAVSRAILALQAAQATIERRIRELSDVGLHGT